GKYPIRVTYLQTNAGQLLYVRYNQGTTDNFGTAKIIPDEKLFRPDPATPPSSMARVNPTDDKEKVVGENSPHANILDMPANALKSSDGKVAVYPNPFSEEIHILFAKENGTVPIAIYDMVSGKPVGQHHVKSGIEAVLNLSELANGSYIMKVGNAH